MNILAVDDDDIALDLLDSAVSAAGYKNLSLARSGEEALVKIRQAAVPFDCFLLDIEMPGINGIELCRAIRKMAQHRETPIIMISALSDRTHIDQAFVAGAIDYLTKPFDPLEIATRLGMSEKLHRARATANSNKSSAASAKAELDSVRAFEMADAITIPDVPATISQLALENYMFRQSRWRLAQTVAVAFSILEVADMFSRTTHSERLYLLTDAADAIASALKQSQFLLSYCGHGTFVCIADREVLSMMDYLEAASQAAIEQIEPVYDDATICTMTLVMGAAVTVPLWAAKDPQNLIAMAIQSAEANRAQKHQERVSARLHQRKGLMK